MQSLSSRLPYIVTVITCLGFFSHVSAADSDPDGRLFEPSVNPLADVETALVRAEDRDRRLLVVLGANWCHDSRALASRLSSSPLAELIQQNYELVFVSVGYYDSGRDVVQHFGVSHYYATPTVLIVDPASGQLVNNEDRHQWANAYNIDMDASLQYFEKWLQGDAIAEPLMESLELQRLYAEVDRFELQQAERVEAGYRVVGPLLEATDAGDEPEEFKTSWNELRKFRGAIPRDMRELRDDAHRRVTAGEQGVQINFPDYPILSWEH